LPRNNEDRFTAAEPETAPTSQTTQTTPEAPPQREPLSFVVPTEFVDLPSSGKFYPPTHPLHSQEHVEVRYMTAKEEDILTSQSLLEKGVALDRLITNLLVDKQIKVDSLLVGDKSAILIAARRSGYGDTYETDITCPACNSNQHSSYDLGVTHTHRGGTEEAEGDEEITLNVNGNFVVTLPSNPVTIEFKLLTGKDEVTLIKAAEHRRKKKLEERMVTDQLNLMIVSINEYTDPSLISKFVDTMTLADTKYLRNIYHQVNPNIQLKEVFVCDECDHSDEIIFPFTTDFFWPQR
jgi:hypothetical protein